MLWRHLIIKGLNWAQWKCLLFNKQSTSIAQQAIRALLFVCATTGVCGAGRAYIRTYNFFNRKSRCFFTKKICIFGRFFIHAFNLRDGPGGEALDEEQALYIKAQIEELSKMTKVSLV